MSRTREDLVKDFADIINKSNRESASDTPDFILAEYLVEALEVFENGVRTREEWYDRSVKDLDGDQA